VAQSSCLILPSNDPTIPAACEGADAYQRYKITGNVTYQATTWLEDYTQDVLETLTYTNACIVAFNKQDSSFPSPASPSTCGTIAANLVASGATTATGPYVSTSNSCNCSMTFTASGTSGDTYGASSASQYVNNKDPAGFPVSYCVQTTGGVTTLTTSHKTLAGYTFQHVLTLSSR
jgi:hypothetical protein